MGTLIRHARPAGPPISIFTLPVAMVEASFRAALVAVVGTAPLLEPGLSTASGAAVALSAITVLADPEHRVAFSAAANPLPENYFAVGRHRCPHAGLDNGNRSWQVRTSFDAW
jgi:hypothetical protein